MEDELPLLEATADVFSLVIGREEIQIGESTDPHFSSRGIVPEEYKKDGKKSESDLMQMLHAESVSGSGRSVKLRTNSTRIRSMEDDLVVGPDVGVGPAEEQTLEHP